MQYVVIIILLALSAFFSSVETAFSSVNKIRLKADADKGSKKAALALKIAESFDKTLTTILVGNNIVNIFSASLATLICTDLFAERFGVGTATAISTAAMTVLVLIFGEILPKSMAKQSPEKFALATCGLLNFFILILSPVSVIFGALQKRVVKAFSSGSDSPTVTEDELKYIIDEIEEEGVLEEKESELVRSALEFDDRSVSEILIPRVRITAVEKNDSIEHIKELFFRDRYSRMPVFEKSIDNIVGFIHERDFFQLIVTDPEADDISEIIHDCLFITEFRTVSEALSLMQKEKTHMAIIKDQYGGTEGMVTMEDLIEELLGEIYDETDEVEQAVVKLSDNEYEAEADYAVHDLEELLELPEGTIKSESVTVGGWALELFERIPEAGESVYDGIFRITVLEAEDNRVIKLKINIARPKEEET